MSPRRASLPPTPSPASRPSVHVPSLSLRVVSVRTARCPLPLPEGALIQLANPQNLQHLRHLRPFPPPLPLLRARPSTSLRFRSGSCPSGLLAAPSHSRRGLLIASFHTIGHNYCVSAPPSPGRFFSFARSFTWSHASLRFGIGPGERPRKGFPACAHHKSNS